MQDRAWDGTEFVRFRGMGETRPESSHRQHGTHRRRVVGCSLRYPRSREDGAAVVELSLVLSLIVIVAWGVIQFGIALNRYQGMQAAAREGARAGAKSQATIEGIQQRVKDALGSVVDTGTTNYVDPCPADPATLATGKFCINVARRDSASSAPVLLTVSGYNPKAQPCNLGHNKIVVVTVHHKMPISVPLWAVGAINADTTGEFRCES